MWLYGENSKGWSSVEARKFSKTHGWNKQKNERATIGQRSKPFWCPQPLPKPFIQKIWVYHGRSWRLSNFHIQRQQKWIFLRCLIFKEFIFPEKRPWKRATSLLNKIVKINLLSQIIRFQVNAPFREF